MGRFLFIGRSFRIVVDRATIGGALFRVGLNHRMSDTCNEGMLSNPPQNSLSQGLSLERIEEAVRRSGYPLQTVVASELKKTFFVTEEWAYPDRTHQENRTLDVFAFKRLREENRHGIGVAPSMALLVECKRSRLPFVFFQSEAWTPERIAEFPIIAGLRSLELKSNGSSAPVFPSQCIGIASEPFVSGGPPICSTFARVAGKGESQSNSKKESDKDHDHSVKGLELTGSDAFNTILLPLASALDHVKNLYKANINSISPVIVFAVCILDAPMIVSRGNPETPELAMVPWTRVIRLEKRAQHNSYLHFTYFFDFVHRYALPEFVDCAVQFAQEIAVRLIEKGPLLKKGNAEVSSLTSWDWHDL